MKEKTVLLTGISGYIGLYCAKELLENGFTVRGTVRNLKKASEVKETLKKASVDTAKLSIVELNLTSPKGWDEAIKGCDYVMHVASPFAIANPKHEDEMIIPAVDGTLTVLRAAQKAKVKRVVLTSSTMTMMASMKTGTFGPDSWTNIETGVVSTYTKSKTLAERAAWEFYYNQNGDNNMELVTINPGGVFGPPLGTDISGQAMTMIDQMLKGKIPMMADVAIPMVDVRDIAKLHVQALTQKNVSGKRVIGAIAEATRLVDIAQILKDEGYKKPSTRIAPNFLLRIMALFDSEAKGMLGMLNMHVSADTSQTVELFDWKPRPFSQSVIETALAINKISKL